MKFLWLLFIIIQSYSSLASTTKENICIYTKGNNRAGVYNLRLSPEVKDGNIACSFSYGHSLKVLEEIKGENRTWYKVEVTDDDIYSEDCDTDRVLEGNSTRAANHIYIAKSITAKAKSKEKCYRYDGKSVEDLSDFQTEGDACTLCKFKTEELNEEERERLMELDILKDAKDYAQDYCKNCSYAEMMKIIKGSMRNSGSRLKRVKINACHTEPWKNLNLTERIERVKYLINKTKARHGWKVDHRIVQCLISIESAGKFSPSSLTTGWENSTAQGISHITMGTFSDLFARKRRRDGSYTTPLYVDGKVYRSKIPRHVKAYKGKPPKTELIKDAELQIESTLATLYWKAKSAGTEKRFSTNRMNREQIRTMLERYHGGAIRKTYARKILSCHDCMKSKNNSASCLKKAFPGTDNKSFKSYKNHCKLNKKLYSKFYKRGDK